MKLFKTETDNYTFYGAVFGICFPITATIIQSFLHFKTFSIQTVIDVQAFSPLLWIIDTAPFFLGLFARFGGRRQDRINYYIHHLEECVKKRTHQLSSANAELTAVNERLKESMDRLRLTQNQLVESERLKTAGNLILMVAHEINTPVGNSITVASHLHKMTEKMHDTCHNGTLKKSELQSYFTMTLEIAMLMLSDLKKAADLIHSFKKLTYVHVSDTRRLIRLKEHISTILANVKNECTQKDAVFTIQCPDDLEIHSYPDVLNQIITMLVINSMSLCGQAGSGRKIIFDISEKDGTVHIHYFDNGEEFQKSFETLRLQPSSFTSISQERFCLQLCTQTVIQYVSQKLNGTIEVVRYKEKGAAFLIRFPRDAAVRDSREKAGCSTNGSQEKGHLDSLHDHSWKE